LHISAKLRSERRSSRICGRYAVNRSRTSRSATVVPIFRLSLSVRTKFFRPGRFGTFDPAPEADGERFFSTGRLSMALKPYHICYFSVRRASTAVDSIFSSTARKTIRTETVPMTLEYEEALHSLRSKRDLVHISRVRQRPNSPLFVGAASSRDSWPESRQDAAPTN
jgi:hypothetical protein